MLSTTSRLVALLERVSGIVLPEREQERFERLAVDRARLNGFQNLASYVQALRRDFGSSEWRDLLSLVTVKESYLFRGARQFEVLAQNLLPAMTIEGNPGLRVWSAGCARGEETATLAIVLSECEALTGKRWEILGTDVDDQALDKARQGFYHKRSLRKVPPAILEKHFEPVGDGFRLDGRLKERIQYRYLNLIDTPYTTLESEPRFDVIFLRNVLIYFRRTSQVRVLTAMANHLMPDGAFFVGPSESLWQIPSRFEAQDFGGCFVHKIRRADTVPKVREPASSSERDLRGKQPYLQEQKFGADRGNSPGPLTSDNDRGTASAISKKDRGMSDDPLVHVLTAIDAEQNGRGEEALKSFRAACYLDQKLFQVRYLMACCLEKAGWVKRAQSEYRAVLALLERNEARALTEARPGALPSRSEVIDSCRKAVRKSC